VEEYSDWQNAQVRREDLKQRIRDIRDTALEEASIWWETTRSKTRDSLLKER
jgi:hypothetical protein